MVSATNCAGHCTFRPQPASEPGTAKALRNYSCTRRIFSPLVRLLHLGGIISGPLHLLERGQVVITQALIVIVDAQAQLDHAVNAARELSRLVKVESRCQQGSVKKQPNQVLHSLVRLI